MLSSHTLVCVCKIVNRMHCALNRCRYFFCIVFLFLGSEVCQVQGGASTKRKSVISCVEDFKSKLDLVDIWRSKNPDAKSFTWSQKSPPVFCRLDYWLISNNLSDFVELTEIIPAVRTDHDAISLELGKLENELKGPGNWKMNCSLLDDEDYEEDIARMIPLWIAEGQKEFTDNRMIWDWIEHNIRAHAIQYSKRKGGRRNMTFRKN